MFLGRKTPTRSITQDAESVNAVLAANFSHYAGVHTETSCPPPYATSTPALTPHQVFKNHVTISLAAACDHLGLNIPIPCDLVVTKAIVTDLWVTIMVASKFLVQ